ncbi:glycosyltransferase family 2 protein [Shewanella baltica]|uniref:glycosyltransferase family 2 protein n=1 Tax=Shewanella baltica TaxID=62322 RepID=UPI00325EA65D
MKLSFILATSNGSEIINDCLESISSLKVNENCTLELIIIDQSFDDTTYAVLENFNFDFPVLYVHSLKRGLSCSRNLGIDLSTGDYVCFADDDATYNSELIIDLNEVVQRKIAVAMSNFSFVGGTVRVPGTDVLTRYTRSDKEHVINKSNFGVDITSISLFIDREFIEFHGIRFDEKLGLGAEYPSCEEVDFVYRILSFNVEGFYSPKIVTYHINPLAYTANKTEDYARGHGAFCKKIVFDHQLSIFSVRYICVKFIKVALKFPYSLIKDGVFPFRYYKGFMNGFKNYKG